jgi:hypothetical protein
MHHGDVSPEIAAGLLELRKRIAAAKIPPSKLDESINVAIWNIREFGKKRRTDAAIHYIAEILGQFDLIALVELRDNLEDFGRVCQYLGTSWDLVYSDWMMDPGGNRERVGFLFDRRAVTFNGLAAEIDAPRTKKGEEYLASRSFWRAPYMCSFRAGNFDFIAVATHARWGDSLEARAAELGMLADWIDTRLKQRTVEDTDQILHLPTMKKRFSNHGGTLDFFISKARIKDLFPGKDYTPLEFTFQLSDHFPVWVQINTDIDGQRLDQIVQNAKKV